MKRSPRISGSPNSPRRGSPRSAAERRGAFLSRERDPLTPEEKAQAVKTLAPHIYPGKAGQSVVLQGASLGSKDSAHDVFFAINDQHPQGPVAIKRYRRPRNADHELNAIASAKERGFLTLQPVGEGVFPLGDLGYALVTERVPNFKTMNQVGWQNYYVGEKEYEGIAATLRNISGFVGTMHKAGIIHHDLQMKNIGQVPPNKFVLFDLENTQFYDPETADYVFHDWCAADLGDMVTSLVSHGYLSDTTDHLFTEELTNNVLGAYMEANPSDAVFDAWDGIVANAIHERHYGNRAMVGSAMGHLMAADMVAAPAR